MRGPIRHDRLDYTKRIDWDVIRNNTLLFCNALEQITHIVEKTRGCNQWTV